MTIHLKFILYLSFTQEVTFLQERQICIYRGSDPKAIANNSCAILRSEQNDYIVSYLQTIEGQRLFLDKAQKATGGAFIPRLSIRDLQDIQIPILPLDHLERLGNKHIDTSPTDELLKLKDELKAKDIQILELQTQYLEMKEFYANRISKIDSQISANDLLQRICSGETTQLEFKSTLRWNIHKKDNDRAIENAALKTIVAFCNSNVGELLIGVSDDGKILGLNHDGFSTTDKLLVHLGNLISERIVPPISEFVEFDIVNLENTNICRVSCKKSTTDIWLKPDNKTPEQFYVRTGPSSKPLGPKDAAEYIRRRFGQFNG